MLHTDLNSLSEDMERVLRAYICWITLPARMVYRVQNKRDIKFYFINLMNPTNEKVSKCIKTYYLSHGESITYGTVSEKLSTNPPIKRITNKNPSVFYP